MHSRNLCKMECYLQCNTVNKKAKFMGKFNIFVSCLNIFLRQRYKNKSILLGTACDHLLQTHLLNPRLVTCVLFSLQKQITSSRIILLPILLAKLHKKAVNSSKKEVKLKVTEVSV